MHGELVLTDRYPRVPMDRRVAAFAIDFVLTAIPSLLFGGATVIVFLLLWLGHRVFWVAANQGQSIGRWAVDTKVVNPRFRILPGLVPLLKREAITGVGAVLVLIGCINLSPTNGFLLIAPIPLLVDCGQAFVDRDRRRAFHDRVADTMMTQTQRGASLDIKVKQIIAVLRRRMK